MKITSVTVFCGASAGNDPIYASAAKSCGEYLAQKNIRLVFGGGKIGMMGLSADAALEAGGRVTGVIPRFLRTKEVAHDGLSEMHEVRSMHERKSLMHDLSDAVIALAGGYGTLEELFEMLTWAQLGLHPKPIGLLNTKGYFNHLLAFLDHMVEEGFLSPANREMILVSDEISELMEKMSAYVAPPIPAWISKDEI